MRLARGLGNTRVYLWSATASEELGLLALEQTTQVAEISATVVGTSAVSANLRALGLMSATAIGTSVVNASLRALALASATVVGTSLVDANLRALGLMSSTAIGTSLVDANLRALGLMASTSVGSAIVSAALSNGSSTVENISATIVGTSLVSARLRNGNALVAPLPPQSRIIIQTRPANTLRLKHGVRTALRVRARTQVASVQYVD